MSGLSDPREGDVAESREMEYAPQTPLGKRLWEIRQRIVDFGEPLLDWEGIEREVAERRGGRA